VKPHSDPTENYPPEEPAGENRPSGAFIDYYLRSDATGPLTLSIYDASGALVRLYSSAQRAPAPDPERLPFPVYWALPPPSLDGSAGMHRFVWDFRYATLPGERDSQLGGGPFAPPGRYAVKMMLAGHTWSQPLVLVKDPRARATDGDLVAQFRLVRQIEQLRVVTATARGKALARHLTALAGAPPASTPGNFTAVPTEFTSLFAVDAGLDQLAGMVGLGDAAPTRDEYAAFAHWRSVLQADLAALK
jgi:hypothetical protein